MLHETTVTSLRRDGSGRVPASSAVPAAAPASSSRPGSPSAPTGSGPASPNRSAPGPRGRGGRRARCSTATSRTRRATATSGRTATAPARASSRPTTEPRACSWAPPPRGCAACAASASSGPSPRCWSRRVLPLADRARGAPAGRPGPRLGRRCPATPAIPRGPGGRWSATRATSRTRSPPTASPTRCATPSCSPGRCSPSRAGAVPEHAALARYQETRDRLSRELFEVTERVAAYDWDAAGIRSLLRRFSAAMGDEVEHLEQLAPRLTSRADVAPGCAVRPDGPRAKWRRLRATRTGVESHRSRLGGCDARRHQPPRRVLGRRRRPRRRRAGLDPPQRRHAGEGARAPARAGGCPASS